MFPLAASTGATKSEELLFKALIQLVVIWGWIPDGVYCMLTIMALITTVMTTTLLSHFMRYSELEPSLRQSEFRRGRRATLPGEDVAKV